MKLEGSNSEQVEKSQHIQLQELLNEVSILKERINTVEGPDEQKIINELDNLKDQSQKLFEGIQTEQLQKIEMKQIHTQFDENLAKLRDQINKRDTNHQSYITQPTIKLNDDLYTQSEVLINREESIAAVDRVAKEGVVAGYVTGLLNKLGIPSA